jgi:hypothetical protein
MVFLKTSHRQCVLLTAVLALSAASCTSLDNVTAPGCSVGLSTASASFDSRGGNGTVSVRAANACNWTVTTNDAWVTFTTPTTGNGDGTVGYTVAANGSGPARSATLSVSGQSFTVSQSGVASSPPPVQTCTYTAAPTSADFKSAGGTGTVTVTADGGCAWTATTQASWLSITSGKSGAGKGSVTYTVAPNNTKHSRSGTIIAAGRTVTISQAGSS